jgi:hypothetical protein
MVIAPEESMKKVDCPKNIPNYQCPTLCVNQLMELEAREGMLRCSVYLCICARVELLSSVTILSNSESTYASRAPLKTLWV